MPMILLMVLNMSVRLVQLDWLSQPIVTLRGLQWDNVGWWRDSSMITVW